MFKPYGVASNEIGLLGLGPRTIEVILGSPTASLFYDLHVLIRVLPPLEPSSLEMGSPPQIHLLLPLY